MSKIKINLTSGNVVEKPLVTCFKGTNGNYIVFDNETNGSMGLPIICISKFNGTAAEKIFDQNEWASVKENLKTIIAGTALPYLNVPEAITAQDDFFTQLTLPVASFDLLKSVYAPAEVSALAPVAEPAPAAPVVEAPPVAPVVPDPAPIAVEPAPMAASEVIAPAPVMPVEPMAPAAPMIDAPIINPAPIAPAPVAEPAPASPVVEAPQVAPAPVNADVPAVPAAPAENNDLAVIKENFMKSCEMMFDALIKKFENK
ncbi:MAG: hypothetical protein E7167_02420 [Firmicutes bacterium]|nr:hypothetical protein [Bacillota bacterium]